MALAVLALVLAGAALLLVAERREVASRVLGAALAARGFPEARFRWTRLDLRGAELRDLSLGPHDALTAGRVVVRWEPGGLRQGRLEEVAVTGLRLALVLDDSALRLDRPASTAGSASTSAGPIPASLDALPIRRASVEDFEVALETPAGALVLTGSGDLADGEARFEARLAAAELEIPGAGRVATPALELTGRLVPEGTRVRFALAVRDAPGCLALRAEGRHDRSSATGQASVYLDAAQLGPGGLDPRTLVPASREWIRSAIGRLEGHGQLRWGAEGAGSSLDLAVRDLDLDLGVARIDQIDTSLHLEGPPWPPPLARGQLLSMARFDFGLELANGVVSYGILPNGAVEIERAEWEFAGGRVRTAGALDFGADVQALLLVIEDVDLAQLLDLMDLAGLKGEGRVSGQLPLFRYADHLEIRDGKLSTGDTGWIRYAADARVRAISEQQEGFAEALKALRDFRYESLEMSLDGDPQGKIRIGLRLLGSNASYYAGHPVDFNLNLEAPLFSLLRSARIGHTVPDAISERLLPVQEPLEPGHTVDCAAPAG